MKTTEEKPRKNKGGRPRVATISKQMQITVKEDDYNLLLKLCSYTGSRPATVMRELLEESRPVFFAMIEALEAAKNNTLPASGTLASKMMDTVLHNPDATDGELQDLFSKKPLLQK